MRRLLLTLGVASAMLMSAASIAESTATTGPCQVGVELRGFPRDPNFTRLIGYTSYVCPSPATNFQVRYQLIGLTAGGGKALVSGWTLTSAPDVGTQQPSIADAPFGIDVPPSWHTQYKWFVLKTVTNYTEDGQNYVQNVTSDKGSVLR